MKALLNRLSRQVFAEDLGVPEPEAPVLVVGDVHGRADLLERLLAKAPGAVEHTVFVGDLVDRGEESAKVLRNVRQLQTQSDKTVCLKGNHEQMLLDFLADPVGTGARWTRFGGLQTLASFGVGGLSIHSEGTALEQAAQQLRQAMGAELIEWITMLPTIWQSGSLAVVHAAADPKRSLAAQDDETLLWGDPGFLHQSRSDKCWVAHGHTVVQHPVYEQSRISIDTGAYYSGMLTGAFVDPSGQVSFTST